MKKGKKTPKQIAKDEAWKAFSLFIRLRDSLFTTKTKTHGKCITCGVVYPIGKLQAGHFISGRHNSYLFSEEGVHAQCVRCNTFLGGEPLKYRRAIIDLYGEGYDEILEQEARKIVKYTAQDYREIRDYYKKEVAWINSLTNWSKRFIVRETTPKPRGY